MKKKIIPRRNFYVHPIQKKYALLTMGLLGLYTLILAVALFVPPAFKLGTSGNLDEMVVAAAQFNALHHRLWPAILITIPIFILLSFVITHRFAGPVDRLQKTLKQIGRGDLSLRLTFRSNDDFQELAERVNEMLSELHGTMVEIHQAGDELKAAIDRVKSEAMNSEGLRDSLKPIEEANEKIETVLNRVKLSSDKPPEGTS